MPVLDAFPELAGAGFDTLMRGVLETGVPYIGREVATAIDVPGRGNEVRFFNFVVQPVRGPSGAFDTPLNISHGVTEVVAARARLERDGESDRTRATFERQLIGIVSHDLRNPLSAIRMGVGLLLRQEDLHPKSLKAATRLHGMVERMVRLVNDLLDFTQARVGAGMPIHRAPMNMHSVVRQVAEEVQMTFPERTIVIEAEGDGDGEWDHDRIAQVALNLVTNALKYSPDDHAIRVATRADGDRVVMPIFNAGAPIAAALLPHLFKAMQRGEGTVGPQTRSVGLGLFIVKHIVDAHGGTIEVASVEGEGTTFTLALPRRAPR